MGDATNAISYFSGGPAKLPNEVLQKISADILQYDNTGVGILEISHRSTSYLNILETAISSVKEVLSVPDNYRILFVPGGGTGQFAAVPMNLVSRTGSADYVVTGTWSKQAMVEASKYGTARNVLGDGPLPSGVPNESTWKLDPNAAYLFYCDNETIHGLEFASIPEPPPGVPLVCDMSSNICSRKVDVSKFGLIFAGAQKNIGCAGVTLVIVREDLLDVTKVKGCPIILDYANIALKNSNYNTPPVYAIHVLGEVLQWVKKKGGIKAMSELNDSKSKMLYSAIDGSQAFYSNRVTKNSRSRMTVVFTIGHGDTRNLALETKFIDEAAKLNLKSLKGHRSVGGMRASIFNVITLEDVKRLVEFMEAFRKENIFS